MDSSEYLRLIEKETLHFKRKVFCKNFKNNPEKTTAASIKPITPGVH